MFSQPYNINATLSKLRIRFAVYGKIDNINVNKILVEKISLITDENYNFTENTGNKGILLNEYQLERYGEEYKCKVDDYKKYHHKHFDLIAYIMTYRANEINRTLTTEQVKKELARMTKLKRDKLNQTKKRRDTINKNKKEYQEFIKKSLSQKRKAISKSINTNKEVKIEENKNTKPIINKDGKFASKKRETTSSKDTSQKKFRKTGKTNDRGRGRGGRGGYRGKPRNQSSDSD